MKGVFTKSFIRALIITVVSASIIAGGVYAYETLWSGKAGITIEPPTEITNGGQVEIKDIWVDKGTYDNPTNTWTVSIARGSNAALYVEIENNAGDAVMVGGYASNTDPASGVKVRPDGYEPIPVGETNIIGFLVTVSTTAEPGTLPDVELEIRQE
jgi:hypothetical protein